VASWRVAVRWIGGDSEIVGGTVLFVILLGWLWRWLARHEDGVRRRWSGLSRHPRLAALRRRFAPQLGFFLARLSPRGYLGLHLTAGVLLLIGASWLFGGIAEDVVAGDPLTVFDKDIAEWFHAHRTPGVTRAMQLVSGLGSTAWVTGVAVVTAFILWRRRCWYQLLALALVLPGGMVLSVLLKIAFHRHRPSFSDSVQTLQGFSFPSGHTMAATLLCGLLASPGWHFLLPPWTPCVEAAVARSKSWKRLRRGTQALHRGQPRRGRTTGSPGLTGSGLVAAQRRRQHHDELR